MMAPLCQLISAWLVVPAARTTPFAQCTPCALGSGSKRGSEVSCEALGDLLMGAFCACSVRVANSATIVRTERNNLFIQPPERDLDWVLFLGGQRKKEAGINVVRCDCISTAEGN